MGFSRFTAGLIWRVATLVATVWLLAAVALHTHWYATALLLAAAVVGEVIWLSAFAGRSNRELARFLDALAYDDAAQSFSGQGRDRSERELAGAMTRAMARLRAGRAEREEQARQLEAVLFHVPVALIGYEPSGVVHLLNPAARHLFQGPLVQVSEFARYGEGFAHALTGLKPGTSTLLHMERPEGTLHLKGAATEFSVRGRRQTLVSLQNIAHELSAQELVAWQTVLRTMAHEMRNSLTPISSLSATARDLIDAARGGLAADDPDAATLDDAAEALEAVVRRSEGLLHFVADHGRLTQRLVVRPQPLRLRRTFTRLSRLLAPELNARSIALSIEVRPETAEISADPELVDQALINLLRNAIDAVSDSAAPRIILSARQSADGRCEIAVADNGPGVPAELREKIFVPFYTTKSHGTGVGLSLVRQIAAVHGATLSVSDAPDGGAQFMLRL